MTSSTISIRPATAQDEAALGRLGAAMVVRHHEFDRRRFIAPPDDLEAGYGRFLMDELALPGRVVLVAEADGQVLGYGYGALEGADWLALRGPAGVIYDLLVDPEHRGAGLGRRLLEAVVAGLGELGASQFVLFAAYQNEGAQRLFARAGFRPTMVEMTRDAD